MDEGLTTEPRSIRENVILYLLLLSSDDCLQVFHEFNQPEKLAFELSRVWFDEIYIAGERYFLGGFKGNHAPALIAQFQDQFNEDELRALERFHRFFELRVEMLSPMNREKRIFPQNDAWKQIMKDAGYLVEELIGDPERMREQLAQLIRNKGKRPRLGDWTGPGAPP